MPRINESCLKQVQNALEAYEQEVGATELASDTKRTYMRHAETFVRWLADDFEPGVNIGGGGD